MFDNVSLYWLNPSFLFSVEKLISTKIYKITHLFITFFDMMVQYLLIIRSLLSDSNQRPRDYKSRALAN